MTAKTGPRPPDDGGAHTSDVRTSTASRTRFSELWRRYLLAASLTAVGRRIVLPDSAMPCASWERFVDAAPICNLRHGHRNGRARTCTPAATFEASCAICYTTRPCPCAGSNRDPQIRILRSCPVGRQGLS